MAGLGVARHGKGSTGCFSVLNPGWSIRWCKQGEVTNGRNQVVEIKRCN
jgi:hypothetical protein